MSLVTSPSTAQDRVAPCDSEDDPEPVPAEVLGADCPYAELKLSLVQSFHALAESYQARGRSLRERLGAVDR